MTALAENITAAFVAVRLLVVVDDPKLRRRQVYRITSRKLTSGGSTKKSLLFRHLWHIRLDAKYGSYNTGPTLWFARRLFLNFVIHFCLLTKYKVYQKNITKNLPSPVRGTQEAMPKSITFTR